MTDLDFVGAGGVTQNLHFEPDEILTGFVFATAEAQASSLVDQTGFCHLEGFRQLFAGGKPQDPAI